VSVAQIYDFEAAVEGGVSAALEAAGLTCYTSQDALVQQKTRPRCEVSFALGTGNQRFVIVDPSTGAAPAGVADSDLWKYRRESAWDCTITISVITEATMAAHTAYRCALRNVMAAVWIAMNGTAPMTRHCYYHVRDAGSTALMMDQDRGFFRTDFTYHGKVSVQADAWAALGE
jgi:hypothetical protein